MYMQPLTKAQSESEKKWKNSAAAENWVQAIWY